MRLLGLDLGGRKVGNGLAQQYFNGGLFWQMANLGPKAGEAIGEEIGKQRLGGSDAACRMLWSADCIINAFESEFSLHTPIVIGRTSTPCARPPII